MSEDYKDSKRFKHLEQMIERDKNFPKIKLNKNSDIVTLMEAPQAKPCPFCGGFYLEVLAADMVVCLDDNCRGAGPIGDSTQEAIEKWNTR